MREQGSSSYARIYGFPPERIEHYRDDKVLLGWIVPEGENFATVDLLGRRSEPVEWFSAEQRLEEIGLGYLMPLAEFTDPDDGE